MDLMKMLKLGTDYLSDYFSVFFMTLQRPTLRFHPVQILPQEQVEILILPKLTDDPYELRLSYKLLTFAIISIFLGWTFTTITPNPNPGPNLSTTIIVVLSYWLFSSCITHLVCKLLGGRGSLIHTLSIKIQIVSVVHVISSFIALLGQIITPSLMFKSVIIWNFIVIQNVDTLIGIYLIVHFVLMSVYLPVGLKYTHNFTRQTALLIAVLLLIIIRAPLSVASVEFYEMTDIVMAGDCEYGTCG